MTLPDPPAGTGDDMRDDPREVAAMLELVRSSRIG